MTEDEARKKAEQLGEKRAHRKIGFFSEGELPFLKAEIVEAYLQCFHDMTSGPSDGWCAWHPDHGYMLCTVACDPTHSEGILEDQHDPDIHGIYDSWIVVPVKLIEVKEK